MTDLLDISVRYAEEYDIDFIINLCKNMLPEQAYMQGYKKSAKLRWKRFIEAPFCELLIFYKKEEKENIGFLMLVKNYNDFVEHEKGNRLSCCDRVYLLFNQPFIVLKKLIRKIKKDRVLFRTDQINGAKYASISPIAIVKSKQGKGFGKQIINYVFEKVREDGFHGLKLLVDKKDINAVKFYRSCGFVETAQTLYFSEYTRFC